MPETIKSPESLPVIPKRYVVPDSFLTEFPNIRADYEKSAKVDLLKTPQPYRISTFWGATDIDARRSQIIFLENLYLKLKDKLQPNLEFQDDIAKRSHIAALRILVAGCLFIKSQIDATYSVGDSSRAELGKVLNKLLKLSCEKAGDNRIDKETRSACLLTAQRFVTHGELFEDLVPSTKALSDEAQWFAFSNYLTQQCDLLQQKYSSFPITDFLVPVFATAMGTAGAAAGGVLGDALGKSSIMTTAKNGFASALGCVALAMAGGSAQLAVIMVVPACASKILDTLCGMTLAGLLGGAMGVAGAGLGWGVGMSLDLACKLLYKGCQLIAAAYYGQEQIPDVTGITLVNSCRIIRGMAFSDDASCQTQIVELSIEEEGLVLSVGTDSKLIPWDLAKLPYIDELRARFNIDTSGQMPAIEDSMSEEDSEEELHPLFN